MLYSHTSELAIRAALYLALQPPGKLSPVHEVARGTSLPGPYLAKIVRRLIRAGIVRAFRGPGGGIELGHSPEAITLWMVVQAMDGSADTGRCVLGLRACSEETPCPLHAQWFPLRAEMQGLLEKTTLDSLAQSLRDAAEVKRDSWLGVASPAARGKSRDRKRRRAS